MRISYLTIDTFYSFDPLLLPLSLEAISSPLSLDNSTAQLPQNWQQELSSLCIPGNPHTLDKFFISELSDETKHELQENLKKIYLRLHGYFDKAFMPLTDMQRCILLNTLAEGTHLCSDGFVTRVNTQCIEMVRPRTLAELLSRIRSQLLQFSIMQQFPPIARTTLEYYYRHGWDIHIENIFFDIFKNFGVQMPNASDAYNFNKLQSVMEYRQGILIPELRNKRDDIVNKLFSQYRACHLIFLLLNELERIFSELGYSGLNASFEGYRHKTYGSISSYLGLVLNYPGYHEAEALVAVASTALREAEVQLLSPLYQQVKVFRQQIQDDPNETVTLKKLAAYALLASLETTCQQIKNTKMMPLKKDLKAAEEQLALILTEIRDKFFISDNDDVIRDINWAVLKKAVLDLLLTEGFILQPVLDEAFLSQTDQDYRDILALYPLTEISEFLKVLSLDIQWKHLLKIRNISPEFFYELIHAEPAFLENLKVYGYKILRDFQQYFVRRAHREWLDQYAFYLTTLFLVIENEDAIHFLDEICQTFSSTSILIEIFSFYLMGQKDSGYPLFFKSFISFISTQAISLNEKQPHMIDQLREATAILPVLYSIVLNLLKDEPEQVLIYCRFMWIVSPKLLNDLLPFRCIEEENGLVDIIPYLANTVKNPGVFLRLLNELYEIAKEPMTQIFFHPKFYLRLDQNKQISHHFFDIVYALAEKNPTHFANMIETEEMNVMIANMTLDEHQRRLRNMWNTRKLGRRQAYYRLQMQLSPKDADKLDHELKEIEWAYSLAPCDIHEPIDAWTMLFDFAKSPHFMNVAHLLRFHYANELSEQTEFLDVNYWIRLFENQSTQAPFDFNEFKKRILYFIKHYPNALARIITPIFLTHFAVFFRKKQIEMNYLELLQCLSVQYPQEMNKVIANQYRAFSGCLLFTLAEQYHAMALIAIIKWMSHHHSESLNQVMQQKYIFNLDGLQCNALLMLLASRVDNEQFLPVIDFLIQKHTKAFRAILQEQNFQNLKEGVLRKSNRLLNSVIKRIEYFFRLVEEADILTLLVNLALDEDKFPHYLSVIEGIPKLCPEKITQLRKSIIKDLLIKKVIFERYSSAAATINIISLFLTPEQLAQKDTEDDPKYLGYYKAILDSLYLEEDPQSEFCRCNIQRLFKLSPACVARVFQWYLDENQILSNSKLVPFFREISGHLGPCLSIQRWLNTQAVYLVLKNALPDWFPGCIHGYLIGALEAKYPDEKTVCEHLIRCLNTHLTAHSVPVIHTFFHNKNIHRQNLQTLITLIEKRKNVLNEISVEQPKLSAALAM